MSGFNDFAPYCTHNGCFTVLNVTDRKNPDHIVDWAAADVQFFRGKGIIHETAKTIKIFNFPIAVGQTRNLLKIPGVSEADIRASLLKGELKHKLLAGDIVITCSDIDLLQFNESQKQFLKDSGIIKGLEVGESQLTEELIIKIEEGSGGIGEIRYVWRQRIPLIGLKNNSNRTFYTPDKFINGMYYDNIFHIEIQHNGQDQYENVDFTIGESSGPGTGYDTIHLISYTPKPTSLLYATYAMKA